MKEDHMMKDCKVTGKLCVHCGERDKHHRSLCPKKFSREATRKPSNSTLMSNDVLPENPSHDEVSSNETAMLSVGEHVVMQTAMVEVMPPDESASEVTRVLMDTGSSRTYVTEDIVTRLKLKPTEPDRLTIHTFGISKPKEIRSPLVPLTLKSKYGNTFNIIANVVPKISVKMQRMPIPLKNRFSIQKKFKLADTLPQQVELSTIGILIGSDYYNDIMKPSTKVEIQQGLYIVNSKFGWMMTGRAKVEEDAAGEMAMFVLTESSSKILPEIRHLSKADDSTLTHPTVEDFSKLEPIRRKKHRSSNKLSQRSNTTKGAKNSRTFRAMIRTVAFEDPPVEPHAKPETKYSDKM